MPKFGEIGRHDDESADLSSFDFREKFAPVADRGSGGVAGRDWGDSAAVTPGGTDPTPRLTATSMSYLTKTKLTVILWPLLSVMLVVAGSIEMRGFGGGGSLPPFGSG